MSEPGGPGRNRRELRRAVRGEAGRARTPGARPGGRPLGTPSGRPARGRRPASTVTVPPVVGFALVMLGMCVLIGLVGGVLLAGSRPGIGVPLLAFAIVSASTAWALATGRRFGYWAGVAVLAVAGLVPGSLAVAAGAPAVAIVLLAPVVVAGLMLRRSVRETAIRRRGAPPVTGAPRTPPGPKGSSRDAGTSGR